MKLRLISIVCFFILYFNSTAISGLNISETSSSVKLKFSNLKIQFDENSNNSILSINELKKYENTDDKLNTYYTFYIAIPSDKANVSYNIISKKSLAPNNHLSQKNDLKIKIEKQNIEKIRDIMLLPIDIYPFEYDKSANQISYIDNFEVEINFYQNIKTSNYKNNSESVFFSNVLNKSHLNELSKLRVKNRNSNILLSNNWYDSNIEYAKIETEKDGLAGIKVSKLIEFLPQIINKPNRYLHLIHNGQKYPYLIRTNNDLISNDDTILFYGLHPSGDTTYFDNYTKYEPFFLYYDESEEALQFTENEDILDNSIPLMNSISIFEHIEEENFYGIGTEYESKFFDGSVERSNFNDSRTVMSEAWYWTQIMPKGFKKNIDKYIFNTFLNIFPSDKPEDKLKISLRYVNNQDSINLSPTLSAMTYFNLFYSINNFLAKQDSIWGFHRNDINYLGNTNVLLSGLNKISLESKQVNETTNERTNIDYIEISGRAKPIAYNDELKFLGEDSDFSIISSGFNSDKITLFDMGNNRYKEYSSKQKGFQFSIGAFKTNDSNSISVGISNNRAFYSQNGIFIQTYNPANNIYDNKQFKETGTELNNYINSLSNGTAIAIAVLVNNTKNDFSSIRNLGSEIIDNYEQGQVYLGAFIKSNANFYEKLDNNYATFSNFIENSNGIDYNYEINVASNSNSNFILVGNNSFDTNIVISRVNNTSLVGKTSDLDAVIISHKEFIDKAHELANYRIKTQNIKVEVVDIDDIYKEFNFGKKSPFAIKNFLYNYYANRNLTKVLLIGDASWDARKKMKGSISTDWIPTYGYPASDWWYTFFNETYDLKPYLSIGRIPANSNQQLADYINKVIDYDTISPQTWMKNILFLIGGKDKAEINRFHGIIDLYYKDEIEKPDFCGSYDKVIKNLDGASTSTQGGEIRSKINQGNLWTFYIGHAASEIFDLDGWYAHSLNNKSRYGVLTTISCNTGAFAEPQLIASRNEQYILEKYKGYIAATGSTFTGFVYEHNFIATRMFEALSDKTMNLRYMGDLILYGKLHFTITQLTQMITGNTFSLLGDPMVKIRVGEESDAYFNENEITLTNQDNQNRFLVSDDYASISGNIYNYGYSIDEEFTLRIIRSYKEQNDTSDIIINGLCNYYDFSDKFTINNMSGKHKFTIIIDPENKIKELNKQNNIFTESIDVFQEGLQNLDPQEYWNINAQNPIFRLINPLDENENSFDYEFKLTKDIDSESSIILSSTQTDDNTIKIYENHIDWSPEINLENGSYWFHSRYINNSNTTMTDWNSIPINVNSENNKSKVIAKIESVDEINLGKIDGLTLHSEEGINELILTRDTISYRSLSVKGNLPDNPDGFDEVGPYVNIEIGNKVFFDGPHDLGFNVVVVKNRNGQLTTRERKFDTWGLEIPYPAKNHFKDNKNAQHLVEFIRDSVQNDEYLFIATCKSSFRLFELYKVYGDEGDYGSIDSLLYYLKLFGSKIADTLQINKIDDGINLSFTMMGWRGAELGTIPEAIHNFGDSALIEGEIITYQNNGYYQSKNIAKAKRWNNIDINANYSYNGTKTTLFVKSINSETNKLDTLLEVNNPTIVDLSNIDAKIYNELNTEIKLEQTDFSITNLQKWAETKLKSISFDFIPADELAISNINTKLDKEPSLRGIPIELSTQIQNLSLRNNVDSALLRLNISRGGTDNNISDFWIRDLAENSNYDFTTTIKTENLDYSNTAYLDIDQKEDLIEFYRFNNNLSIDINTIRDTIKPSCVIKVDGKYLQYNDYISTYPEFEIELFDNSPLQITDSTSISVRINGYIHPYQRTIWSRFESINDGTNLKARFTFQPDTIEFEDVSIIVYISDSEGNRDTITTFARTSLRNANIIDAITYPNPAIEEINFQFDYVAPLQGGAYDIYIYDIAGNFIDKLTNNLTVGKNSIKWLSKNQYNNSLSSGVYIYKIILNTKYYTEPIFGKFIKIN